MCQNIDGFVVDVEEAVNASPEVQQRPVTGDNVWVKLQMRWHFVEFQQTSLFPLPVRRAVGDAAGTVTIFAAMRLGADFLLRSSRRRRRNPRLHIVGDQRDVTFRNSSRDSLRHLERNIRVRRSNSQVSGHLGRNTVTFCRGQVTSRSPCDSVATRVFATSPVGRHSEHRDCLWLLLG